MGKHLISLCVMSGGSIFFFFYIVKAISQGKKCAVAINSKDLPPCNTSHLGTRINLVWNFPISDWSINIKNLRNSEIHGQGFFQMLTWLWVTEIQIYVAYKKKKSFTLKITPHPGFQENQKHLQPTNGPGSTLENFCHHCKGTENQA